VLVTKGASAVSREAPIALPPGSADSADRVVKGFHALFIAAQDHRRQTWLESDLTMAQMRAFWAIARHGSASVGTVGRELGVGLPAASHLVDRLVQAGLVQRHPHPTDRRVTVCELSAGGRRLLEQAEESGPRMLRAWLEEMDPRDVEALARGLTALVQVVARHGGQARGEGRDPA
jgi:DNA-binding MarR family transcriptional regulator